MARKSFQELAAELPVSFPDNNTELITPAILRGYLDLFLQAIRPSYAVLNRETPNSQTLGVTDVPLIFENATLTDVPDYTAVAATGTITRLERGTTRHTFTSTVEGAVNRLVTVVLYRNGLATPWRISASLQGAGKPVDVSLTAILYTSVAATFQWRVLADTAGTAVTFSNLDALAETVPVNAYT